MYYYLGYGSVYIVTLLLFVYTCMYCYQLLYAVPMNVFYVDYSSLWLMFLCCNIDYK